MASRAGLSPDAVAALERGKRNMPRATTAGLLADALALSEAERAELLSAGRPESVFPAAGQAPGADGPLSARALPHQIGSSVQLSLAQPTPLVDRTEEMATICTRLTVEGVRLLTLTGPAGVGKTRLALAAAARIADQFSDRFADGIVVVDLTPVRDPEEVLDMIARTIGFTDAGSPPLRERIVAFLQGRAFLLIVDNFEQVLPAATALAGLLAACPRLALLVTSRVPLRLLWEQTLRIAPLPVPDLEALPPLDALAQIPSVALFLERARARRGAFALTDAQARQVARLVTQLDGLPLALELAAAPLDVLPLATITRRLGIRLRQLRWEAPDVPERQRSLEAAVGWSYDLLSAEEQRLFRHLGVFVGRVTSEAVAAVADFQPAAANARAELAADGDAISRQEGGALDMLVSLAEKSLVLPGWPREPGGGNEGADDEVPELAFGMLETVRAYAWEQLDRQGELEATRRAHAHAFLALAERAEPQLRGREQRAWYLRLECEHDNLRAALRWLLDQDDLAERAAGLRLAAALGYFWWTRGYLAEGWRWLEEALSCAPVGESDPTVRTQALIAAGRMLMYRGGHGRARTLLEEAQTLARQYHDPAGLAWSYLLLGASPLYAGSDVASSIPLLREAVGRAQALGEPNCIVVALYHLGTAVQAQGDVTGAASYYTEALHLVEATGDIRPSASIHFALAVLVARWGDLPAAMRHVRVGLEICVSLRDRWLLSIGVRAAMSLLREHADPSARVRLLGAADALRQATGAGNAFWEQVKAGHDVAGQREGAERDEEQWAAYREGRTLPFREVAALALSLLEEYAQTSAAPETEDEPATAQRQAPPARQVSRLSAREREVLQLVAQGLSSKAIGQRLSLSASTVNQHVTSIFNKLGADTRAQAVAVAAQRGLL